MKGSRAALRYAKAILDLAKDQKSAESVHQDMNTIIKTIEASSDLRVFLKSPVVSEKIKKDALTEVFSGTGQLTKNFFGILLENKRIGLLSEIAAQYNGLYNKMNNVQLAYVTTVVPLTAALEEKILAKVKELTGNEAKIKNIIDQSIIGGFILRVGDLQYNASLSHQLKTLKREFYNDTYISKLN